MKMWKRYVNSSFVLKMSVGFILGIFIGIIFGEHAAVLDPLGKIFLNLLSLVAIPIIFLTVVLAVQNMNLSQLGRMGGKLVVYYAFTTAAAVLIGLTLALWIEPGADLKLPEVSVEQPDEPIFSEVLLQIFPDNLVGAFSSGNVLAIMFIAVIMGLSVSTMKYAKNSKTASQGELLSQFFEAVNEMLFNVLRGILLYAPIGVLAISATTFGNQGLTTFISLLKFAGVFYLGIGIVWSVVYTGFLKAFGYSVIRFLKDTKEAYLTAFFTSSSIVTLPVAIKAAQKAGISKTTAHLALPLGAVFNADGGAVRMGVSIVFAANITQLNLSLPDLLTIVLIGTLLSIGTAGVPAAGLVTLSAVLTLFNLPLEIVALIAGIDALIGMGGTASNVMGDVVGAAVVDKWEAKRKAKSSA